MSGGITAVARARALVAEVQTVNRALRDGSVAVGGADLAVAVTGPPDDRLVVTTVEAVQGGWRYAIAAFDDDGGARWRHEAWEHRHAVDTMRWLVTTALTSLTENRGYSV